jgi:hypothetical protein
MTTRTVRAAFTRIRNRSAAFCGPRQRGSPTLCVTIGMACVTVIPGASSGPGALRNSEGIGGTGSVAGERVTQPLKPAVKLSIRVVETFVTLADPRCVLPVKVNS